MVLLFFITFQNLKWLKIQNPRAQEKIKFVLSLLYLKKSTIILHIVVENAERSCENRMIVTRRNY